jgi:hypothetical protein
MSRVESTIRCVTFSEPKRGSGPKEYEDACAGNLALGRFAVADGATESAYAGVWARLLVDEFVSTGAAELDSWGAWLPTVQSRWEAAVGEQPLPWYAEIKWQQGAFATFLGVVLRPPRWHALAVGDSCLFHIRSQRLHQAFPVAHACDFTNTPWLVGSRDCSAQMLAQRSLHHEGEFQAGDRLWLMTDALAQWFLQIAELGHRPWELLEPLLHLPDAASNFKAWITTLREARQIRNDDVTLMAVWSEKTANGPPP